MEIDLFSYGTLQLPQVQRATYGRLLHGSPDTLTGYRLEPLPITDAGVIRVSGSATHRIAVHTGVAADQVSGVVFTLSAAELAATDAYEVDVYARILVRLASGREAFAYIGAPGL